MRVLQWFVRARSVTGSLARKFHRFTAADADLPVSAALNTARVLDVLSSTTARPDSRSPCRYRHLHALASRIGEIFGLAASTIESTTRAALLIAVLGVGATLAGCGQESGHGYLRAKIGVGDEVPRSRNRTVADPAEWHRVSTMDTKVDLYRWEIADLIGRSRPFLVVFGTPQHCTMCVDQIVRVQIMQEKHGDRFAFIHVDGYKDNAVWVEWGVTGEPWTFLVGADGKVSKVLPGQTEIGLLEDEMHRLLKDAA